MTTQRQVFLLDTNVVILYVRGQALARWIDATYHLSLSWNTLLVSAVTLGEARSLALKWGWGEQRQRQLQELLYGLVVFDIHDEPILAAYADIDIYSESVGRSIGQNDMWISATARALGAPLLTTDSDFDHLHPQWIERIWIDPRVVRQP